MSLNVSRHQKVFKKELFCLSLNVNKLEQYLKRIRTLSFKYFFQYMVRQLKIDNVTWVHLADFCQETLKIRNPGCVAERLRKQGVLMKKIAVTNTRGSKRLTNFVTSEVTQMLTAQHRPVYKDGYVYCFIPIASDKIIKVGRTINWKKRGYTGFNRPKKLIVLQKVRNYVDCETMLLQMFQKNRSFVQRLDLGLEWFETNSSEHDIKKFVLDTIKDFVCLV